MLTNRLITPALSRRNSTGLVSSSWHSTDHEKDGRFRVIELFSGIGCMHHALMKISSLLDKDIHVEAVDINTLANEVYAQSFNSPHLAPHTFSLDRLTADTLDQFAPDMIMLSPPCQPYTTTSQAKRRDEQDPRARSMIVFTECLKQMSLPPRYLIMENVEGFVGSNVHRIMLETLKKVGYKVEQFLISPHQLNIPYFRARFFLLASRRDLVQEDEVGADPAPLELIRHPPSIPIEAMNVLGISRSSGDSQWPPASFPGKCVLEPITSQCTPLGSYLDLDIAPGSQEWQQHAIPKDVLSKFHKCFDIVTPSSRHCNCITKNYAINHRGAGSILLTTPFDQLQSIDSQSIEQDDRGRIYFNSDPTDTPLYPHLRYLTPSEISRLHGLPSPYLLSNLNSQKNAINLLGNSLSVDVFAWLLAHLLVK
jgi:tRNA (cytosine38-C5)-methyltransferase